MEGLIYRDLNGKARLRRYVVAVLMILAALAIVAVFSGKDTAADGLESPLPIAGEPATQVHETTAFITESPDQTPASDVCPKDPDDWTLVEVFPGDHYQRIEPACVYDELARTAAWMLLERLGHNKIQAAALLGFEAVPWNPALTINGYTNLKGPLELNLLPEWPAHPDFEFWQVDRDGTPAVAISLRGCYRSSDPVYGMICVLALDRSPGSAVSVLGDYHFASHAANLPGSRTFQLTGYSQEQGWRLIGQLDGLSIEIESLDQMNEERRTVTAKLGTQTWDSLWMFETYGLEMNPLPENWRLFDLDQEAIQEISRELNAYISPELGNTDEE